MKKEEQAGKSATPTTKDFIGTRLKWARERKGLSQEELGQAVKVSQAAIDQAERGITAKPKFLPEAAEALGVTYEFLVGKSSFTETVTHAIQSRAFIEQIAPTGEAINPPWSIPPAALGLNPAALSGLEVREVIGDAMVPDLRSGDYTVVNTGDIVPSPAGLFMIHDGHGLQIRRIESIAPKRLRVSASNPAYPPFEAAPDDVTIYGRIVLKIGRI